MTGNEREKGHFVLRERKDNCESAGNCTVAQCSFHPSRSELVCALDDGQVRLLKDEFNSNSSPTWTLDSSSLISSSRITCLAWNTDGTHLAAGFADGSVSLWRSNFRFPAQTKRFHRLAVLGVYWGRWNPHLFATRTRYEGDIQRIFLWNAESEELSLSRFYEIESRFVWDCQWISATRISICTHEGFIYVFHIGRSTPIKMLCHTGVWRISWLCGYNLLVSGSSDGSIKVWSVDKQAVQMQHQLPDRVYCIDCYYDTSQENGLIACGLEDGSIIIWDPLTSQSIKILDGYHRDAVFRLSFSPDGCYLASADMEEKMIIWRTNTWEKVFEYTKANCITWYNFSWDHESRHLAISNNTSSVFIVEFVDGAGQIGLASEGL